MLIQLITIRPNRIQFARTFVMALERGSLSELALFTCGPSATRYMGFASTTNYFPRAVTDWSGSGSADNFKPPSVLTPNVPPFTHLLRTYECRTKCLRCAPGDGPPRLPRLYTTW
jgi:hypothetical protein